MKKYMFFAVAALAMTFAACSSSDDNNDAPAQKLEISLVKPADFAISSNGVQIAGTQTRAYTASKEDIMAKILDEKSNVEVNLSKLTYDTHATAAEDAKYYYASKLSVHVRGNVGTTTVTIPVSAKLWANVRNQDDWLKFSTEISAALVKMNAEYAAQAAGQNLKIAVSHANDAITITLSGITQDVLDYCKTTYGDNKVNCGVTFEIWTYYNGESYKNADNETIKLKDELDKTTVAFTTAPDVFINSFGKVIPEGKNEEDATKNPDDCTVKAAATYTGLQTKQETVKLRNTFYDAYTTAEYWATVKKNIEDNYKQ